VTTVRMVPPWRSRKTRGMVWALVALIVLWAGVGVAVDVLVDGARLLPARVVAARPYTRKGSPYYGVIYSYTDENGVEHQDRRDLVAGIAREEGFTTVGKEVKVKLLFGQPLLEGAPNVFAVVPWIFAGMAAFIATILFLIDRGERRKAKLALEGMLTRGRIVKTSAFAFRGSKTITIHYEFDGRSGKEKLATRAGPDSYVQLGLDRPHGAGSTIWIAYDANDPGRSVIYSFGEEDAYAVPAGPLAPLPPGLTVDTPRALPPGPPGLSLLAWLVIPICVALAIGGAILGAAPNGDKTDLMPLFMVGGFVVTFIAALLGPALVETVFAARRTLRTGVPLVAKVIHVEWLDKKRLSVSFEARTPEGSFRAKERVEFRRLERMGAKPAVGDTIFLCHRAGRPWERAVWGFAKP